MKKAIPLFLVVILLSIFTLVFAVSSSAAEAKKYKFIFSTTLPSTGWQSVHTMMPWFEQVEKVTNGQITFEPYWGGSLVKVRATWDSLKNGICDVTDVGFHYFPGLVDLHTVITLPFLEYQSAEHESIVNWKLYEQFPEIRNEYKDNKVLLFYTSTPFFFISNKKQIKSMGDFKGLKVRVTGGEALRYMVELAGGIPTTVSGAEIYSALEKGVIDATVTNWDMLMIFRLYEVAKYYFVGPFNAGARGLCMNWPSWNSLTPDLQEKLMSVCGMEGSRFWARKTYDESEGPVREKVKSEGYQIIQTNASPAEMKKWEDLYSEKLWGYWIKLALKEAKAQGHPDPEGLVKKILSTTQELIKTTAK